MKNPRTARDPSTIVNRTVTPRRPRNADLREREYLTPKEVDRLQDAARKHSRYGHRDATAVLIASEISDVGRGVPAGAGAIGLDHRPQRADRHATFHLAEFLVCIEATGGQVAGFQEETFGRPLGRCARKSRV